MDMLHAWNQSIRLTGYRTVQDIRTHLVLDSILANFSMNPSFQNQVHVDFGSGNGTPGIIFSILNPESPYLLIEKIEKKRIYMEYVIRHLGLKNAIVLPRFQDPLVSPVIWMKAVTIADFMKDSRTNRTIRPPITFLRFGADEDPSCKHIRTYVINGSVSRWKESHSLTLSEAVYQGES